MRYILAISLALASGAASAQNINPPAQTPAPTYKTITLSAVPVVAGDITDRPYRVIGEIKAEVRKFSLVDGDPEESKIFSELWERAEKLGADAVVNASYGSPRVTVISWGSVKARGQAIKFLTDGEIAALPTGERIIAIIPPQP